MVKFNEQLLIDSDGKPIKQSTKQSRSLHKVLDALNKYADRLANSSKKSNANH